MLVIDTIEIEDPQIIAAIRTGVRPDGRELAPIMPWRDLAALTDSDVNALVAYLKSLRPVSNRVPGPFGPEEKVEIFRMTIAPPPGGNQPERMP